MSSCRAPFQTVKTNQDSPDMTARNYLGWTLCRATARAPHLPPADQRQLFISIFRAPSAWTGQPDTEPGTIARPLDPCLHCHSPTVESRLCYVDGTFLNFSLSIVPAPSRPGRTSPRDQWPGGHTFFLSREAFCYVDGTFAIFHFQFFRPQADRVGRPLQTSAQAATVFS